MLWGMKRSVALLVALLAACSPLVDQRTAAAAQRAQQSADQLRGAVAKAERAKVRVMLNGRDREREFALPPQEFGALCAALKHVAPAPPPDPAAAWVAAGGGVELQYYAELVLVGADGVELTGVVVNVLPWVRESEARRPYKRRGGDAPEWCLPDADYDTVAGLPTLARAKAWGAGQGGEAPVDDFPPDEGWPGEA